MSDDWQRRLDEQRREQQRQEERYREAKRLEAQQNEAFARRLLEQQASNSRQMDAVRAARDLARLCIFCGVNLRVKGPYCQTCDSTIDTAAEAAALQDRQRRAWKDFVSQLPLQDHHLATDKNKEVSNYMLKITHKYNLDFDDNWNLVRMHHRGKHPYEYHAFVLGTMQYIDDVAKGNREEFKRLYKELVENTVREHPEMLRKAAWGDKGPHSGARKKISKLPFSRRRP
ncbi:MAG TPA: AHH domain-containing protein [Acidobacteriaceae bacterium]|nr:AHH domain-containing protein [Acidobacteriaceae bacterium]